MKKGSTVELEFADPEDAIPKQPDPCAAEKRLWYSVLEMAFKDATGELMRGGFHEQRSTAKDRDEARLWFASKETGPGSLAWILQMTGLPTTVKELRLRVAGWGG